MNTRGYPSGEEELERVVAEFRATIQGVTNEQAQLGHVPERVETREST